MSLDTFCNYSNYSFVLWFMKLLIHDYWKQGNIIPLSQTVFELCVVDVGKLLSPCFRFSSLLISILIVCWNFIFNVRCFCGKKFRKFSFVFRKCMRLMIFHSSLICPNTSITKSEMAQASKRSYLFGEKAKESQEKGEAARNQQRLPILWGGTLFLHPWAQLECEPLSQMRRQAQVSLKPLTGLQTPNPLGSLANHVMFLDLHLQLCSFDLVERCEAVCLARQSPGGHTREEEGCGACLPAPSGTSSQSRRTFLLRPPFLSPLPSSTQALARTGWTHPLILKPTHPWRDSQPKWERRADQRDHPFYYRMALPQHSIKLCSVEIRPNSGSSPGHGCQDRIEKHLAGQFEVLGLAMKEIHFQPCVPGSYLPSWLEMPGLLQRICLPGEGEEILWCLHWCLSSLCDQIPAKKQTEGKRGLLWHKTGRCITSRHGRVAISSLRQLPHIWKDQELRIWQNAGLGCKPLTSNRLWPTSSS